MKRLHVYFSLCALSAPLPALAAGGAFEINQDCVAVGCFAGDTAKFPVTITQSGTYVLTSDLAANSVNDDAIDIQADRVDLDLNGHTIDGGGTCTGTPVTACTGGALGGTGINILASSSGARIRVHDGTVRGFGNTGIYGGNAGDGTVLEHLTVAENNAHGIYFPSNVYSSTLRVSNSMIVRNMPAGLIGLPNLSVENCVFSGNQSTGLRATGESTVANSRFEHNGGLGLWASSSDATALDHNVFRHNNGGTAQWDISGALLDMGGNVCADHACP